MIRKFVFDANSLISANLLPNSISRKAYDYARVVGVMIYSNATFEEFSQTFVRSKFDKYLSIAKRRSEISTYQQQGELIIVEHSINVCRDPKDNKYLELAMEANADCIVTGDNDLLVLHPFQNIPILTPAEFLEQF